MSMPEQISPAEASGKAVCKMGVCAEHAVIVFADGTFVFLQAEVVEDDEAEVRSVKFSPKKHGCYGVVHQTFSDDQIRAMREEAKEELAREREKAEAKERREYERLHRKYGIKDEGPLFQSR